MNKKDKNFEVCLCKKKTRGEVEEVIKNNNITTLKELCDIADVGNKCGACRTDLEEILNEVKNETK